MQSFAPHTAQLPQMPQTRQIPQMPQQNKSAGQQSVHPLFSNGSILSNYDMYLWTFGTAMGLAAHDAISTVVTAIIFPLLGVLFLDSTDFAAFNLMIGPVKVGVGKALGEIVAFVFTVAVVVFIVRSVPFIQHNVQEETRNEERTDAIALETLMLLRDIRNRMA